MRFVNFLPLISSICVFVLGILVYSKKRDSKVNFYFFLHALVITAWLFFTFLMFMAQGNREMAIFWDRFIYMSVVFIPVFMVQFGLAYANQKNNKLIYLGYFFTLVFLCVIPTKYFVDDLFVYQWGVHTKARLFHHLFLLYFTGYVVIWFYYILGYYKTIINPLVKEQCKYIILAFFLLFTIGPMAYLPAYGIGIYPFSYISGLIFTIIISYAIIVHRLMDIKLVMRRYSVYLMSLSVILILAIAIRYLAEKYLINFSILVDFFILVAGISSFPSIRNYFYKTANKYFFSSLYDSAEVISSLSDRLRSTLDADKIYEYVSAILINSFHTKAMGLLIYNENKKIFRIQYNNGFQVSNQIDFNEDVKLNNIFIKKNKAVITDEIRHLPILKNNKTVELLVHLGVAVLAPLNIKDRIIGLIAIGNKESGDMYNDEDLKVLEVVGAQTAIALENALLYKETKNFNIKLEKEVEKATRDLRKANEQLKKLDEAKSEFISIASHQLRTPLTVIKGYISMMLEGNFGELTKPEKESLEKVFESNERLINLVENLLNISRIESGRMQFNYAKADFLKMVDSVLEELSSNAKKKNLKLDYTNKIKALQPLMIDEEKIRQVAMNLIDNAIKYTKQGSVTVKLEKEEDHIKFSVSDSGMGIRKEDLPNLFKKFSRGTGTSLVHTEGTGLGLYVARMMIEEHKGKIWAESKGEGRGSKFAFELPIK